MTEIWRDIDGYDGLYQVSNLGRVKSFKYKTPRITKGAVGIRGYLYVNLYRGGKCKHAYVHRLVAKAFIPNSDNKPQVNHINGDKSDNRVVNLEWCTPSENVQHAFDAGLISALRGENNPRAKLTNEQARYVRDNPDGLTQQELADKFGIDPSTISDIQCGITYVTVGGKIRAKINRRIPDEIRAEIKRLYIYGSQEFGARALARKYRCSQKTVRKIINEN